MMKKERTSSNGKQDLGVNHLIPNYRVVLVSFHQRLLIEQYLQTDNLTLSKEMIRI